VNTFYKFPNILNLGSENIVNVIELIFVVYIVKISRDAYQGQMSEWSKELVLRSSVLFTSRRDLIQTLYTSLSSY
jgi:hypothetical protein